MNTDIHSSPYDDTEPLPGPSPAPPQEEIR